MDRRARPGPICTSFIPRARDVASRSRRKSAVRCASSCACALLISIELSHTRLFILAFVDHVLGLADRSSYRTALADSHRYRNADVGFDKLLKLSGGPSAGVAVDP